MKKKEIDKKIKLLVYNTSLSWTTEKKLESAITAAEIKQLRKIAEFTYLDRI